jgi:mannose-6-phosphate isomerase
MERIWGGHALKSMFSVDSEQPIGEYWVVSGHPNGMSVVADGPHAGQTLTALTERFPEAYLGQSPQPRFPLLIKFLEAEADLSVQIHPDDAYAQANEGDFGKTEAWYVLDAKPDGVVNYGHSFDSKASYQAAVANGHVRDYLKYQNVRAGDLVYVPARTLHALLAGTKVLEIQQTSDVTYRVYDWDRKDENGQGRALHVEKAADVLQYGVEHAKMTRSVLRDDEKLRQSRLATCPYFTIDELLVHAQVTCPLGHKGNPDVIIAVEGHGQLSCDVDGERHTLRLKPGDAVLVPGTLSDYELIPDGEMTLVRTFY